MKWQKFEACSPSPAAVRRARNDAGHSTKEAAFTAHTGQRNWQKWESGDSNMPPSSWELYLIKTGQHPGYSKREK